VVSDTTARTASSASYMTAASHMSSRPSVVRDYNQVIGIKKDEANPFITEVSRPCDFLSATNAFSSTPRRSIFVPLVSASRLSPLPPLSRTMPSTLPAEFFGARSLLTASLQSSRLLRFLTPPPTMSTLCVSPSLRLENVPCPWSLFRQSTTPKRMPVSTGAPRKSALPVPLPLPRTTHPWVNNTTIAVCSLLSTCMKSLVARR
jgi:hypothetical protein